MRPKPKYTAGAAVSFWSQAKAVKKLQLSLKDFRRLCILKGIYPREPKHRKQAQKGATDNKLLFSVKDIRFLSREPLIEKFRSDKLFLKKLATAKGKKDQGKIKKLHQSKTEFPLDNIVRERYPTFSAALRDLDDCLCMTFAIGALPSMPGLQGQTIADSRRLTSEFMHYVIESRSLTKVFVSIKGIYYQASIMGEKVTWLVGHERSVGALGEVDLKMMSTFTQFYITVLKFVNFRLFKSLSIQYPPRLFDADQHDVESEDKSAAKICSLAKPLLRAENMENPVEMDTFDENGGGEDMAEKIREAERLRTLFSKLYFFLSREVSKESLAFVIRSGGGNVSWENCPSQPFEESSPLVTHVIMDRPLTKVDPKRLFLQPQWVFDSFNARRLLPIDHYKVGSNLPPHLSPFVDERVGEYIPLERLEQLKEDGKDVTHLLEDAFSGQLAKQKKDAEIIRAENAAIGVKVKEGKVQKPNAQHQLNEAGQNLKLREMLIQKKNRRLYQKLKKTEHQTQKDKRKLTLKRRRTREAEEVDEIKILE